MTGGKSNDFAWYNISILYKILCAIYFTDMIEKAFRSDFLARYNPLEFSDEKMGSLERMKCMMY